MKKLKFRSIFCLVILFIGLIAACTNIKKLYRGGEVREQEFFEKIPFEAKLDLMIIPVKIGDQTYHFLFDTGAPTVISREVYKAIGKPSLGKRQAGDSQGGRQKLEFTVIDSLQIGKVTFLQTASLIADLTAAIEIKCLKIDGILGANLMKLAYWKIDPPQKAIFFSSDLAKLTSNLRDSISISFRPNMAFKPFFDLKLDGEKIPNFLFDTGAGDYISMGRDLLKKESLLAKYHGLGSTGLYGSKMDTLRIGKTELGIGTFSQVCEATYKSGNAKRILGMDFMKQFTFILNWQDHRIDLYPENVEEQYFSMFDVIPRWKDNQLIIGTMRLDSKDIPDGLQVGDTILAVNDQSFTGEKEEEYCRLILKANAQLTDTLKFTMANGITYSFPRKKFALK